jgi:hypothetical protein
MLMLTCPSLSTFCHGLQGEGYTSLDGLRSSDAGAPVPREAVSASALFTNGFLPQ